MSKSVDIRTRVATSLIFVFPLLLAYEVGVVFSDRVNGVDFLTRTLLWVAGSDLSVYLAVHVGLAMVYLVVVLVLRRKSHVDFGEFLPMLLESAIYALTLGTLIVFVMENLLGLDGALAVAAMGQFVDVVLTSLGAGVHEELIFRLCLFGGGWAMLVRLGLARSTAVPLALLASAALFALAHHVGPLGEPLKFGVFVYRALAGIVFGLIFYYRSFAHAVYSHFLYDVYVLTLHS